MRPSRALFIYFFVCETVGPFETGSFGVGVCAVLRKGHVGGGGGGGWATSSGLRTMYTMLRGYLVT